MSSLLKRLLYLVIGIVAVALIVIGVMVFKSSSASKTKVNKTPEAPVAKKEIRWSGAVMTVGGRPIPGAKVTLTEQLKDDKGTPKTLSAVADKQGQFTFESQPGLWSVDARAKGYISPGPEALRGLKVNANNAQALELVLRRPIKVSGKIVAGGKPVGGAKIGALYQFADGVGGPLKDFALDAVTTSKADGSFEVSEMAPGRFQLLVEAPSYDMVQSRPLFARQGRAMDNIVIDLAPSASLVFEVVSSTGEPLLATITLEGKSLPQRIQQKAGATGKVRFDRLPAGPLKATARLSGYATETLDVDAVASTLKKHDLVMTKASGIFGRVIYPENATKKRAIVALLSADGKRVRSVRVDEQGFFQMEKVPSAVESVQAVSPHYGPSRALSATPGKEMVLTLGGGGTIKGKVVTSSGQPLTSYGIAVEEMILDAPKVYGRRWIRPQNVNNPQGLFEMGPLAPGKYVLRVQPNGKYASASSTQITVKPAQSTDGVVITVNKGASITGVISDEKGPVAGVRVALFDPDSRFRARSTSTNASGQYTLENVRPGRQSLRVSRRGYLTQIVAGVELDAGQNTTRNVTLEKAKPGERFAFHGIGASLRKSDKGIVILNTMKDMPAATYGLKAKDVIVSVDGEDTTEMRLMDVIKRIRGQEGVSVAIEIEREGEGRMTFDVERGRVVVKSRGRRRPRQRPNTPSKPTGN